MSNWMKYTFVCDPNECDTLIEVTCPSGYDFPSGVVEMNCPCGRKMSYISATIRELTNERKQMEVTLNSSSFTTDEQIKALEQLVQNKDAMITSLQNQHSGCDYWKSENGRVQSQIIDVIDEIYAGEWTDESDIAKTLCEIIDYNPVKEIEFTATMHFTGSIDIPRNEQNDFDLTEALSDAYVDINNGDVIIDSYDIEEADEA